MARDEWVTTLDVMVYAFLMQNKSGPFLNLAVF